MATRKTRSLMDFEEYAAAAAKLDDLQSGLDAARNELSAAQQVSAGANAAAVERAEALAMLDTDGSVAVAVKSLAELQRDVRIRELAVAEQQRVANAIGERIEQGETAAVELDAFRATVQGMEKTLGILAAQMEAMQAQRAGIQRRFGGRCSLPMIGLNQNFIVALPYARQVLRQACDHFGISEAK